MSRRYLNCRKHYWRNGMSPNIFKSCYDHKRTTIYESKLYYCHLIEERIEFHSYILDQYNILLKSDQT